MLLLSDFLIDCLFIKTNMTPINMKKMLYIICIKKNCMVERLLNVFRLLFLSSIITSFNKTVNHNLYTTSSSHQREIMLYIVYIKKKWIVVQWLLNDCWLLLLSDLLIYLKDRYISLHPINKKKCSIQYIFKKIASLLNDCWMFLDCYFCLLP